MSYFKAKCTNSLSAGVPPSGPSRRLGSCQRPRSSPAVFKKPTFTGMDRRRTGRKGKGGKIGEEVEGDLAHLKILVGAPFRSSYGNSTSVRLSV